MRRGLIPVLEGAVIESLEQRRPDLRFPLPDRFAERVKGRTITGLARRAKFLLAHLDGGEVLVCHLGMSGSFRVGTREAEDAPGIFAHDRSKDSKHDHVVFHVRPAGALNCTVTYNDPRRFGFMLLIDNEELPNHPMFARLGIEPTGNGMDGFAIRHLFGNRKTPLKAALLDQKLIAGLGNIYACEALWRAGLDPRRQAGTIVRLRRGSADGCGQLATAVREVIADAIEAGGSSLRDYVHADGSLGYFQHKFSVYDREGRPCARTGCIGVIERIAQSGRSTFFCPSCQR